MKPKTKNNILVFLTMVLSAIYQYICGSSSTQVDRGPQTKRPRSKQNRCHGDHDHHHEKCSHEAGCKPGNSTTSTPQGADRLRRSCKKVQAEKLVPAGSSSMPSKLSSKPTSEGHEPGSHALPKKKRDSTNSWRRMGFSKSIHLMQFEKSPRKDSKVTDAGPRKLSLKLARRRYLPGSSFLPKGISRLAAFFRRRRGYRRLTTVPPQKQPADEEGLSPPNTTRIIRTSLKSEESPRNEKMDAEVIFHVTQAFQRIFSHVPYSVYGLSALVQHGYTGVLPRTVHILCPEHTRQAIYHWSTIQPLMRLSPLEGRDYWGEDDNEYYVYDRRLDETGSQDKTDLVFALGIPDGTLRRVRVIFENEGEFNKLPAVPAPMPPNVPSEFCSATPVNVISLPATVVRIVSGYQQSLTEGASVDTQKVMADGLMWVLQQIIKSPPSDELSGSWVQNLSRDQLFLVPFTESFPRVIPLLRQVGIGI